MFRKDELGGVGLIVNAILTSGEGISLTVTNQAKGLLAVMRGKTPEADVVEEINEPEKENV